MSASVASADLDRLYRSLRLIRRVEEVIAEIYPSDKIKSPVHLSIGQESVAVGVCDALNRDDFTAMTYRGHATYLAKGGDLNAMMAELYGKATGCGRGKAGSMHLVDMGNNVLGASAVVATTIPMAAGYAYALRREGRGRIMAAFFGDGATEEGVFSETVHFAALKKLPVLFVMEDNGYAIHSPRAQRWPTDGLLERVETYGIATASVDDGDVLKIRAAAAQLIDGVRAGDGPAFLACKTYRWHAHVGPELDYDQGYRDRDEMLRWQANDSMEAIGTQLDPARRAEIDKSVEEQIEAACAFAESSPFPPREDLYAHVYAD